MANSWAEAGKRKMNLEYLVVPERKDFKNKRTKEKEKGKKMDICQKDTGNNPTELPTVKTATV